MLSSLERGQRGEDIALQYLRSRGYRVDARNVRYGKYEIDIVAYDPQEKMMVFVEVKMRSSHSDAYPIHSALHARKRRAMRRAVARWVIAHHYEGAGRVDLLSVCNDTVVEHIHAVGADIT